MANPIARLNIFTKLHTALLCVAGVAALCLHEHAAAQAVETEYSNPKIGYLEYKSATCRAEVEIPLTSKSFHLAFFTQLLEQGREGALRVCAAADRDSPQKSYSYAWRWKTAAIVRKYNVGAFTGSEFEWTGSKTAQKRIRSIVYDRSADRALTLEDLFVSPSTMREVLVPAVRSALAQWKRENTDVELSEDQLRSFLPDDMDWPNMTWGVAGADRGYQFGALWFHFPNGRFSYLDQKDLRGRVSSEGSALFKIDVASFKSALNPAYAGAFMDSSEP